MINPERGEVALVVDGQRHVMRLTLGALAALEARLEAQSLMALAQRFEAGDVRTSELLALLAAGLAGSDIGEGELAQSHIEGGAVGAMRAGVELLSRAFRPFEDQDA